MTGRGPRGNGGNEAVPHPGNRGNVAGAGIVCGQDLPKPVNVLGNRRIADVGVFPDGVDDRVLAHGRTLRAYEQQQQAELFRAKCNGAAAMAQRTGECVEHEIPKYELRHAQSEPARTRGRDPVDDGRQFCPKDTAAQQRTPQYAFVRLRRMLGRIDMPFVRLSLVGLVVLLMVAGTRQAPLLAAGGPYATMAPLERYLIPDREEEIRLARSAAPEAVSRDATILVLTRRGYQVAAKGSNGFTCLVERAWMKSFDDREFWDWKMRAPTCYNAEAARTILRYTYKRTDMALAGLARAAILARITAAVTAKQLPSPEPGAMAYMTSKDQYLTDANKAWMPHLMFYAPKPDSAKDGASWGADLPGSPVLFDSAHHINPEPWTLFFVPIAHWSDGSPAPAM